jgi:hypothetical protein
MYGHQIVSIEELDNIVYDTLVTDSELFSKYHIQAPCNIYKGLQYIINSIKEADKEYGVTVIKITYMGSYTAGFIVCFDNILYSFGINVHYRDTAAATMFWEALDKFFEGKPFFCTLHNRNTRAIKFLEKWEGSILNIDNNTTTICL